ncbi:MAG: PspC domain-containing protein [Saprospiraceae bacterium]|nr:PspC domain-containing protein [Saprospiraceae bacterium]
MNKTYNINIGGYPFTIDDDAYAILHSYLNKIEGHFRRSEGCDEILEDIERRIAELLEQRLKSKKIVAKDDINQVISILGTPEDFGAASEDGAIYDEPVSGREYKTGKKLYRDPDDKVIGGVCSGLAAYFGIQEPVWVRVAFALIFFAGGLSVPIYILLWALVPVAQTPGDFLAMRGEKINVRNIAKIVEEQVEQISDQLSEIGQDWKSKRRKKKSERKERKSWKDHL